MGCGRHCPLYLMDRFSGLIFHHSCHLGLFAFLEDSRHTKQVPTLSLCLVVPLSGGPAPAISMVPAFPFTQGLVLKTTTPHPHSLLPLLAKLDVLAYYDHFPLCKTVSSRETDTLSCSWSFPQHLKQCLTNNKCSINIFQINGIQRLMQRLKLNYTPEFVHCEFNL